MRRAIVWFTVIFMAATFITPVFSESGLSSTGTNTLEKTGGLYIEFTAEPPESYDAEDTDQAINDAVGILRSRLSQYDAKEFNVYRIGQYGIRAEVPYDFNLDLLLSIGEAYQLALVNPKGETIMTGEMVLSAEYGNMHDNHVIYLQFTPEGTKIFADETAKAVGRSISIFLDDELICSPTVQTMIPDGSCVISGLESEEVARRLAALLQIGPLPVKLKTESADSFGPRQTAQPHN